MGLQGGRRLIATDYDGTLCQGGEVGAETLEAIARWRAAGHLFGVATGRSFPSILDELAAKGVPYDFLVCLNGAEIYDGENALCHQVVMETEAVASVLPSLLAGVELGAVTNGRLEEAIPKALAAAFWTPFVEAGGVAQVSLRYHDEAATEQMIQTLMASDGRFTPFRNGRWINMVAAGISKEYGIDLVRRMQQVDLAQVYAVGDNFNDEGMLRRFGGYAIRESPIAEALKPCKTCGDIAEMIGALLG